MPRATFTVLVFLLFALSLVSALDVPTGFLDTPASRSLALGNFYAKVTAAQAASVEGAGLHPAEHSLKKRGFDFQDFVSLFRQGVSVGCFFGLLDPKVGLTSSRACEARDASFHVESTRIRTLVRLHCMLTRANSRLFSASSFARFQLVDCFDSLVPRGLASLNPAHPDPNPMQPLFPPLRPLPRPLSKPPSQLRRSSRFPKHFAGTMRDQLPSIYQGMGEYSGGELRGSDYY